MMITSADYTYPLAKTMKSIIMKHSIEQLQWSFIAGFGGEIMVFRGR
jgi:hypothetical protein